MHMEYTFTLSLFFDFNQMINLILISFFILLKFVPIKFIHPLRVKKLKIYSIVFMILWFFTTLKILLGTFYQFQTIYDLAFIIIWISSNIYFFSLTIYEILFDIFKVISVKLNNHQF